MEWLLRNPHLRSPQYPVLNRIPDLLTIDNSPRRRSRNRGLVERLVSIGIEHVTCGVEGFDMVFEESLLEEAVRHVHAFVELCQVR